VQYGYKIVSFARKPSQALIVFFHLYQKVICKSLPSALSGNLLASSYQPFPGAALAGGGNASGKSRGIDCNHNEVMRHEKD
jgi:hypothetical protein